MKTLKLVVKAHKTARKLFAFCLVLILWIHATSIAALEDEGTHPRALNKWEQNDIYQAQQTKDDRAKDPSIGNHRVRFQFARNGKWLGLFPSWAGDHSLFSEGAFFVLASSEEGSARVIANTGDGTLSSKEISSGIERCCEGMKGGNRAPALDPDDDGDGEINEDPLDGTDNDGDGLVDEDFAAIGDEMFVIEYEKRDERGMPELSFHQESYSWALPHIEGMIALRLCVRNTGEKHLKNVRIGAFLQKEGPCVLSREQVTNRANLNSVPEQAQAIICSDPKGAALEILFPDISQGNDAGISWSVWASRADGPFESALESHLNGNIPLEVSPGIAKTQEHTTGFNDLGIKQVAIGEKAFVGGVSPDLGNLAPGEHVEVAVALVAVQKRIARERALVDAHRTYIGDGTHRFVPPPVPVTPLVVWGKYEVADGPEGGLIITLENSPARNIDPSRITFLSGVDLSDLEIVKEPSDEWKFYIHGQSAERLFKKNGERIILRGREDSGVFFDAVLNPAKDFYSRPYIGTENVELFWNTAGKLQEDFLSSSPNPFREQTTIYYEVPAVVATEDGQELPFRGAVDTSLKIYDVTGRLVSVLIDEVNGPGRYQTEWRAVDENGNSVASGVYYVKLQIGKRYITKRLLLLK